MNRTVNDTSSGVANNPVSVPAEGFKSRGLDWSDRSKRGQDFTRIAGAQAAVAEGLKGAGDGWFNDAKRKGGAETGYLSRSGSKSPARQAASAKIAKIPFALSSWIARTYKPELIGRAA